MIYVTHDQVEAMTLGQRIVVLDGGQIQQIDTPMRLYEKPANLFVAGFLGSPAMNLLRGPLRHGDGWHLETPQGDVRLGTMKTQAPALQTWIDREVVLGVRPEDLRPASDANATISAVLEVTEPVGNEIFLNLRRGEQTLVSRVPPGTLPDAGRVMHFELALDRLHLFDPASGARIA
jgi:multiple sugar transport system ATP-binding protein